MRGWRRISLGKQGQGHALNLETLAGVLMARPPLVREALIHRRANETVKCVHRHTPPLDPLPATISNNGKW